MSREAQMPLPVVVGGPSQSAPTLHERRSLAGSPARQRRAGYDAAVAAVNSVPVAVPLWQKRCVSVSGVVLRSASEKNVPGAIVRPTRPAASGARKQVWKVISESAGESVTGTGAAHALPRAVHRSSPDWGTW